jgi:hypothetical protein
MATNTTGHTKVFVSKIQQNLKTSWDNSRHRLAAYILDLERDYSPNPRASRISIDSTYISSAFLLLCQVPDDMITSIFGNRLVQDVLSRAIRLPRWHLLSPLRIVVKGAPRPPPKAGVYILYLTRPKGEGLSIEEYEWFVRAMRAAVTNISIRQSSGHQIRRNITNECNDFIERYTKRQILNISKIQQSCLKHIADFSRYQAALIAEAKADGSTEIRLHGEVGWSADMDVRFAQHQDFDGSAAFFRLARCVLECLFPGEFTMHGISLFRAMQQKDADFGEAMGSHIATSYAEYGGWNYEQGGMHTRSGKILSVDRYKDCAKQHPALVNFIVDSVQQEFTRWEQRNNTLKVRSSRHYHSRC